MDYFKTVEALFEKLMTELSGVFSDYEISLIKKYIYAGENALALETIVDIIEEEKKPVTLEMKSLIKELGNVMQLDPHVYINRLP
jgi:hypothetical protein